MFPPITPNRKMQTHAIAACSITEHEKLTELYLQRGESHLLLGEYVEALSQLEQVDNPDKLLWHRAFICLGKMGVFSTLGMSASLEQEFETFRELATQRKSIDPCPCSPHWKHRTNHIILTEGVDPLSPQPSWWCEQTVKNTTAAARGLAVGLKLNMTLINSIQRP